MVDNLRNIFSVKQHACLGATCLSCVYLCILMFDYLSIEIFLTALTEFFTPYISIISMYLHKHTCTCMHTFFLPLSHFFTFVWKQTVLWKNWKKCIENYLESRATSIKITYACQNVPVGCFRGWYAKIVTEKQLIHCGLSVKMGGWS